MRDIRAHGPGAGHLIEGVPFYPQQRYMCGPAALASVIGYWGASVDVDEIARRVYDEGRRGALPVDMVIYAKERGFDALYYRGGFDDLRERLSEGTPLILFLNVGFRLYPVGHYIVATGYDDRLGAVLAHSGTAKDRVFTYRELERLWGGTSYSTLLVRPKGGEAG